MHTIRAFEKTESEYLTLARILSDNNDDLHLIAEGFEHCDAMQNSAVHQRFVADIEDQIVAYGTHGQSVWYPVPGMFTIAIEVHPDYRRQGIGSDLYESIVASLQKHSPKKITARARENNPAAIDFLKKRGFIQKSQESLFALDLSTFDRTTFDDAFEEMQKQGIKFLSLAELRLSDPDWLRKWWDLEWVILNDMPSDEPPVRRSLEQFEVDIQHPAVIPDAFFFAVDGGQLVGISGLTRYDETSLHADLTWVIPDYQEKGIELALKLKTIDYALRHGASYVLDDALEGDLAYQINLDLGFQHLPPWLVFEKVMK